MSVANTRFFKRKVLLAMVAAVALAGCQSNPEDPDAESADSNSTEDSSTYGAGERDGVNAADRAGSNGAMSGEDADLINQTVFYFDFDEATIRPDAYAALKAHASKLAQNSGMFVRIEGHADERGTREYNVALGERRASAIAKFMKVNGVSGSQMEVVSYGEEKPMSYGHEENSWAQNRRVELKF